MTPDFTGAPHFSTQKMAFPDKELQKSFNMETANFQLATGSRLSAREILLAAWLDGTHR